jgi:hypothetical protein
MIRRPFLILLPFCAVLCGVTSPPASPQSSASDFPSDSRQQSDNASELGTLKICLRLEDQTPFLGAATVRILPDGGYELMASPDPANGQAVFPAVPPAQYSIEVSAPTFATVTLRARLEPGAREKLLFVVMKRQISIEKEERTLQLTDMIQPKTEIEANIKPPAMRMQSHMFAESTVPKVETWKPDPWDDGGAVLDPGTTCPAEQILGSVTQRVKEFVSSVEKFTATETIEHYPVDKDGQRKRPDIRKFAYVVTVARDGNSFYLDEYRNGDIDQEKFPAGIATVGLPAVVLVFHPHFSADFDFSCDGLVHVHGHDYWQLRFAQRLDRRVRIESYIVNGSANPIYLQGRAWIDPAKGQVVRIESQLEKPNPRIELSQQHQIIQYTAVKFTTTGQTIWLPQSAEVYVERHGKRYYRRHSFQDFRLFNVDTSQTFKPPKGSYTFTNLSDRALAGELTVKPVEGLKGGPIALHFEVPAHGTVVKIVGLGKDVNLPAEQVGSAQFVHTGSSNDAVKVDVNLATETTLDIIPDQALLQP